MCCVARPFQLPLQLLPPEEQEDILTEARAHGGRVLVTRETEAQQAGASGGSARQVVEIFEPVTGPEAVQTPKQVRGGRGERPRQLPSRVCF